MTLEISAEKRRLASLTMGWFSASSAALPDAAARFFFGAAAGVPGRSVSLRLGCDWRSVAVRMRSASALKRVGSMALESAVWICRVSPVRVRVASWTAVGGGLLAFDGGEGGDEGGLKGVEVEVCLWGRLDEVRAVIGLAAGSGARAREPSVVAGAVIALGQSMRGATSRGCVWCR